MSNPPTLAIHGEDRDQFGNLTALRVLPEAALAHKLAVRALFEKWDATERLFHFLLRRVVALASEGRIDRAVAAELFGAAVDFAAEKNLDVDWAEHRRELAQMGRDEASAVERYVRPRPGETPSAPPGSPPSS